MTAAAIAARHVTYRVGSTTILDDVSIEVAYGRLLALVGPNGAGKSSLLRVLTGDAHPAPGEVLMDGAPMRALSPRELSRRRAVLPQEDQVAFAFTAREVIEMGRSPWIGTDRADLDIDVMSRAIQRADVGHLLDREVPSLSGGERARVSLARVLAQDTAVVMLDEPTAALDLRHQEDVLGTARDLARDGRAVVVVLHDLSLAAAYADDVAMVDRGTVAAHGSPQTVLTQDRVAEIYGTRVRVVADPDTGRPLILPRRTTG